MTVAADGQITRYEFDKFGQQTAVITHAVQIGGSWVSHRVEFEYDEHGRRKVERTNVRQVWSANPNSVGSTATFTIDQSQARPTTFDYDVFGNLKKTTFADNSFTTADYDNFDRKTSETDQLGKTRAFQYDSQNRLTAVLLPPVVNPANNQTVSPKYEYGYDAFGNQVLIRDPLLHETRFTFDAYNRQTSRTLPLGYGPDGIRSTADDSSVPAGSRGDPLSSGSRRWL